MVPMPDFFLGLIAAGVPFLIVVAGGIYTMERWSNRAHALAVRRVGTKRT